MASLLVQAGADPSCGLTDLLEFHINLVKDDGKGPDDCSDMPLDQKFTVGLGGKIGLSRKQLIADTRALLEQFIDKGLDVNGSLGHPSKLLSPAFFFDRFSANRVFDFAETLSFSPLSFEFFP